MKNLMLMLLLLANVALGQNLPTVVDNSQWFPPVRSQETMPNCTHFSLIYYLKSAIWNRKFNRDPKLEINQFNHNFVWNQNSHPVYKISDVESAFYFMPTQGCATGSDFPFNEQDVIKPDLSVREKALPYKSKRLFTGAFFGYGPENSDAYVAQKINALKDSLAQGKCFVLGIQLFKYFNQMTTANNVYSCSPGISSDSIDYGHAFTIVGYNDTIKTTYGRGAFQVINSNINPAQGHFYLDYNWFYFAKWQSFNYWFLEEDFSSVPQVAVSVKINNGISGKDILEHNHLFTDATLISSSKKVDFVDFFNYLFSGNQIQVSEVNGYNIALRSKVMVRPLNNLDGNYELISDLSDLTSAGDFKSISIVIFDPVSANYIGANGQSFLSYTRESKLSIDDAWITFLGTDKKIKAKVKDLADTTIVATDFYSVAAGLNLQPFQEQIYVQSCTSVLKRKLVTFSIADLQTGTPPVFTRVPSGDILAQEGDVATFTFKAVDTANSVITYSITNGLGASINPTTGLFSYVANQVGDFYFSVSASNGISSVSTQFKVKVSPAAYNAAPVFSAKAEGGFNVLQGEVVNYQFKATDPEGLPITYILASGTGATLSPTTGVFEYRAQNVGRFAFEVQASDGIKLGVANFLIDVNLNNPPVFTKVPDNQDLSVGENFVFSFSAYDQEGKAISFSIVEGVGASINPSTGEFSYAATSIGNFVVKVGISDGFSTSIFSLTINVKAANTAPVFVAPPASLTVYVNETLTHPFFAYDAENDQVTFSILSPLAEAQISSNGILTFKSSKVDTFDLTIVVSDGKLSTNLLVTIRVDLKVGIDDVFESEYSIKAYPNPVATNLNIEFILKKRCLINIALYDLQGRQITLINQADYEIGQNTIDYDTSQLRGGVYILRLTSAKENFTKSIKIIKQ